MFDFYKLMIKLGEAEKYIWASMTIKDLYTSRLVCKAWYAVVGEKLCVLTSSLAIQEAETNGKVPLWKSPQRVPCDTKDSFDARSSVYLPYSVGNEAVQHIANMHILAREAYQRNYYFWREKTHEHSHNIHKPVDVSAAKTNQLSLEDDTTSLSASKEVLSLEQQNPDLARKGEKCFNNSQVEMEFHRLHKIHVGEWRTSYSSNLEVLRCVARSGIALESIVFQCKKQTRLALPFLEKLSIHKMRGLPIFCCPNVSFSNCPDCTDVILNPAMEDFTIMIISPVTPSQVDLSPRIALVTRDDLKRVCEQNRVAFPHLTHLCIDGPGKQSSSSTPPPHQCGSECYDMHLQKDLYTNISIFLKSTKTLQEVRLHLHEHEIIGESEALFEESASRHVEYTHTFIRSIVQNANKAARAKDKSLRIDETPCEFNFCFYATSLHLTQNLYEAWADLANESGQHRISDGRRRLAEHYNFGDALQATYDIIYGGSMRVEFFEYVSDDKGVEEKVVLYAINYFYEQRQTEWRY